MAQFGGAAGRWGGPGNVYLMTYTAGHKRYHKIGCSGNPFERLKQIQKQENNPKITLYHFVLAYNMRGAETAAQNAIVALFGAVKDPARGGATDWFVLRRLPENVWPVIQQAVHQHNAAVQQLVYP